jgi:quinoprotein glucose dehydrogenase
MPGFSMFTTKDLDALVAYLTNPADGATLSPPLPRPDAPPPKGELRYYSPYGYMHANNGLPVIGPPWSTLTAYDLNLGTIKWQVPLGTVRSLDARGATNTGSYHPTRNGLAVTAGGLVFVGTWSDRTVRAYDKDTGRVLWEKELEANPEGIPSVYEVDGRQFVAFCTRTGRLFAYVGTESVAWKPGKPEAQGYYVFALPNRP